MSRERPLLGLRCHAVGRGHASWGNVTAESFQCVWRTQGSASCERALGRLVAESPWMVRVPQDADPRRSDAAEESGHCLRIREVAMRFEQNVDLVSQRQISPRRLRALSAILVEG